MSRGLFGYDDKVADIWPQFAQAGKADVTVRQLLGHQAGLCVLKPLPTVGDLADPARLSAILAAQKPAWPPGTRHGYHAITLGWYESELIRRTDPAGRTLGRFFADEIAGPLGLDLHIGLPDSVSRERVAHVHNFSRAESLLHLNVMPPALLAAPSIRSDCSPEPVPFPATSCPGTATTTATTYAPSRFRRPTESGQPALLPSSTVPRWPGTLPWA